MTSLKYYGYFPTGNGKFGQFGGQYVPETLMPALEELEKNYLKYRDDPSFQAELDQIRRDYMGRETPLFFAANLSKKYGCKIYLKREDLVHGGAHKLNNSMGQALLAKKMGKRKLVAETGAGQHGFATAIAGAFFGMDTTVFMGSVDVERQAYNVTRMRFLGTKIVPVEIGAKTLKEAISEGLRYWISNLDDTYYLMGTVAGPHPYPMMVRDFQSVIGKEIREQILEKEGRLPNAVVACVGGGSNAMGSFYRFIEDDNVELWGVEAGGLGLDGIHHAASLQKGTDGYLHGARQLVLQDEHRNIRDTYSIAAGLDYPGVSPELCYLKQIHRIKLGSATDKEAIEACIILSRMEGIIPALESSHAIAYGLNLARTLKSDDILVINISGNGSKDIERILPQAEGMKI